jgi:pyruvate dehydrogenase (quinone)
MKDGERTAADLLVEQLIEWGVEVIFGLPGDGINGILESLRQEKERIRFVQVRHEEAAALAAVGYSKFTGRLGVCPGHHRSRRNPPSEWSI